MLLFPLRTENIYNKGKQLAVICNKTNAMTAQNTVLIHFSTIKHTIKWESKELSSAY